MLYHITEFFSMIVILIIIVYYVHDNNDVCYTGGYKISETDALPYLVKQNRTTEGCSKLKRSVDMTSSGKNGLNIRTNTSPKRDRDQVSGGVSVLCWLAAPVAMSYGNLQILVISSKSVIKSSSVIISQICVMPDRLRVSLYMVLSQNVM